TVDSVAQRVGFDDPKYFARVFRGVTGTTPSSYRRSRLAE
ncbi:MAG: AraC family transcriptional regulator, partial [Chloroflexota bacterium]